MTNKQADRVRLIIGLTFIAIGIVTVIFGTGVEKVFAFPVFLFALYPLAKIGFEDNYKI